MPDRRVRLRPWPWPARPFGRDGRAGPVPRVEERLRRGGLRPGARRRDPDWWEQVPVQRWVVRRSTMVMTGSQAVSVDVRSQAWGQPPYNGMTVYRADFDAWLAEHAVAAGAKLVTSTVATGLLRDGAGRVIGCANRPARRRPGGQGRHRLRRRQLVPGQGGRPASSSGRRPSHPRRQRGPGPARRTSSKNASVSCPARGWTSK